MICQSIRNLTAVVGFVLSILLAGVIVHPQSQALDGQIEGFVYDQNGAVIAGATVIATNTANGFVRNILSDDKGFFRMPLMPLGTYRFTAEALNYMRAVREGVTLVTGQTVTIDITLNSGLVVDSVTVTADGPIVDTGKTDVGRVLTDRETGNLPLVARNPHNFILQQANVNGRPSRGLNFPSISANGYLRRVNYQLDGNTATQADRAGVRLITVSETYVKEVQLVSNAFAPEFGNTPGLIFNVVTPSGTNKFEGSVAYLFRRPSFYSRPFGFPPSEPLPDNSVDNVAVKFSLPLRRDRWHLYGGYEFLTKDDKAQTNRLLKITEPHKLALIAAGLPASVFPPAIPTFERDHFLLVRTDLQLNENHRLALRFNYSNGFLADNIQGDLNTLERSIDTSNPEYGIAAQLVSYSTRMVNELRFQFVRRKVSNHANEHSGSGPSVVIRDVANFGAPENIGTLTPIEKAAQVQNNLTFVRGAHVTKFGGGLVRIGDRTRAEVFSRYTFPSIDAYNLARSGIDPRSYTRYEESSGDAENRYRATYWNLFVQDDWKITNRLKLNFGLRYDLYQVPIADPTAAYELSRKFNTDKDNFAPRVAAVYAFSQGKRAAVLRVGAGMYYETPWLNMYERALRKNGNPRYFNYSITPIGDPKEAPGFPTIFPGGLSLQIQDIDAIAPDIESLYAVHLTTQFEQAVTDDSSFIIGYAHSAGRHIAVYRDINYIPVSHLRDGRPVYSQAVSAATRFDPRFDNISMAESSGRSRYDALTLQFNARSLNGLQMNASYTFSKAIDNAPEQNLANAGAPNLVLSNPYDQNFDRGRSLSDQRHTLVVSLVARPTFRSDNKLLRIILNNNQFGVITYANSGYAFNIISLTDLNNDGMRQDRPLGITRNSGTTPPLFNLDLRYSRFIPFGERFKLEMFAEFTNFFNVNSIVQYNNPSVPTDGSGQIIGGIPDFRNYASTSQESRQTQIGIRFVF